MREVPLVLDAVCSGGGPEVRSVLYSIEIQRVGMLHTLASKIYQPKESLLVRVPQQWDSDGKEKPRRHTAEPAAGTVMRNYFSMKKNDKITNLLGSRAKKHYRRSSSRHQTRHAAHAEHQAAFSHDFQQFHKITKNPSSVSCIFFAVAPSGSGMFQCQG